MKQSVVIALLLAGHSLRLCAQQAPVYHKGWTDFNKNGRMDVYEDSTQPIDKRVDDLLSQMTLEEKSCQLATLYGYGRVLKDELPTPAWQQAIWKDGIANIDEQLNGVPFHPEAATAYSYPYGKHVWAINAIQAWFIEKTRLGIPVDFTNEGVHGLCSDRATSLPAPISIGATWNRALVRQAGQMVGREARALGYTNVYAPILDPARDQRWGRVVECYSEDPYLVAALGTEMSAGIQSEGVASTLKHFAVYSVPKGGRDGEVRTDPHVAPREMEQLYLYPFRKVIAAVHPWGVMSSYNDWDGVPITGSHYFLTELLRQRFGFDGYVVSDSRAVEYIYEKHHVAADFKDATRQAISAGLNVWTNFNMPDAYINNVRALVREGKLSRQLLDQRVGEVLRVKFRMGLFDRPFRDTAAAAGLVHTAADEALSQEFDRQGLVLLKNEKALLPLSIDHYKNILVTGPLADATQYAISRYGPNNNPVTSVYRGIRDRAGNRARVMYEQGCTVTNKGWPESEIMTTPLDKDERSAIARAVAAAKKSDIIIAVLGEDEKTVGEGLSRTSLDLPGRQELLLEALYATGKPVVLVLVNGQPLTVNWANRYVPAILEAGFPGPSAGKAVAQTLFGDYNPGGKLSMTWPKTVGQIEFNFPYKPASQADQEAHQRNGAGNTIVNGALYPFGYGLSYSSFAYSNLVVKPERQGPQGQVDVWVDVTNTGSREGDEVAQLYVKDKLSSVITYEMQLRGFDRIHLKPGEKKTVHFTLQPDDLSLLNADMHWVVEPGAFDVMVGSSSTDIRVRKEFVIE